MKKLKTTKETLKGNKQLINFEVRKWTCTYRNETTGSKWLDNRVRPAFPYKHNVVIDARLAFSPWAIIKQTNVWDTCLQALDNRQHKTIISQKWETHKVSPTIASVFYLAQFPWPFNKFKKGTVAVLNWGVRDQSSVHLIWLKNAKQKVQKYVGNPHKSLAKKRRLQMCRTKPIKA